MSLEVKKVFEYMPVETANDVVSCEDVVECHQLRNWKRWLKMRKQQHEHLGLMVCRSATSLLMNRIPDEYRSKIELKWMIDQAQKIKKICMYNNNNIESDSLIKETEEYTSIYVPDVVRFEQGMQQIGRDARAHLETRFFQAGLCEELCMLKTIRPMMLQDLQCLAIVGKKITIALPKGQGSVKVIPTVHICSVPPNACKKLVAKPTCTVVKINNDEFIIGGNNICCGRSIVLKSMLNSVKTTRVDEDIMLNDILVENCGETAVHYKWTKEENSPSTSILQYSYSGVSKTPLFGSFYFDNRPGVIGPGQTSRLPVLFRPKKSGPHSENWIFHVHLLNGFESVLRVVIPLQGCGTSAVDYKTLTNKLERTIISSQANSTCKQLTDDIVRNAFYEEITPLVDRCQYSTCKMNYLYRALRTQSLCISQLMSKCMGLDNCSRDKYMDLIGRTCVVLLKQDVIPGYLKMTHRQLDAHKTMYFALNCIDLILYTYESDYDEACRQVENSTHPMYTTIGLSKYNHSNMSSESTEYSDSEILSYDSPIKHYNRHRHHRPPFTVRQEWINAIGRIVYKQLEWAVDNIIVDDKRLVRCNHNFLENHPKTEETDNNCRKMSLVDHFFVNRYI